MKTYQVIIEWTIKDTRENHFGFRIGNSKFLIKAKNKIEAINEAIKSVEFLPIWEVTKNGIDLDEYRESNEYRFHYETKISKILSVKAIQGEKQ